MPFDYGQPAEMFMQSRKRGGRRVGYRRFRTAAEAIRFAVEELPEYPGLQTWLDVGRIASTAMPSAGCTRAPNSLPRRTQ